MILEGIVTSRNAAGELNVAPMGPVVSEEMSTLLLRPFQTSQTYQNLKQHPEGVFHVVDDVLLLARAAIGQLDAEPPTFEASEISGRVLRDCCRWFEFRVEELDDSDERTRIQCRVVHSGRKRDFFGLHRARHAVVEAAILATRVHLLPADEIRQQLDALRIIVKKTAGPREFEAFDLVDRFVTAHAKPDSDSEANDREHSISTGARLHFGLLAHRPASGREAGGVGVMIDRPGWSLRVKRGAGDAVRVSGEAARQAPECADRIRLLLSRLRENQPRLALPLEVAVEAAIPAHRGLGSGTQLALALSSLVMQAHGQELPDVEQLATSAGRGLRSAIGAWGFEQGGLLVDGGKREAVCRKPSGGSDRPTHTASLSPLVARVEFPAEWRFLLIAPATRAGLSGQAEQQAFNELPSTPSSTVDQLCRIALMELLPAVQEHCFSEVSRALRDYGQIVGESFAKVQGGRFAEPGMAELMQQLEARGVSGIAQTSWGPTTAILCDSDAMAKELAAAVPQLVDFGEPVEIITSRPLNRGAVQACQ